MGRSKPTAAFFFDARREKGEGTYPVKIRVTYQRKTRLFKTTVDLAPEQWQLVKGSSQRRFNAELQGAKKNLDYWLKKANAIIDQIPEFSFEEFDRKFSDKEAAEKKKNDDVHAVFQEYIKQVRDEGRSSTATAYQTAANSLQGFRKVLRLSELTPAVLSEYEKYLLARSKDPHKGLTTVGVYTRALRTVVNTAIKAGLMSVDNYPFGRGRYVIPGGRNIKKALSREDIKKIVEYAAPEGTARQKARDFWVFSYLCNGMNFKDLCNLKWRNIDGDVGAFFRQKIQHTGRATQRAASIHLTEEVHAIIRRWGNSDRRPDAYVFPIFVEGITASRQRELVQNLTKTTNKYLKRISSELGIEKPVTTNVARHSFATMLKRSNKVSLEYISESLGHRDVRTTEYYLDSFESETRREVANILTDF